MTSIGDIARGLGISRSTVSKALRGSSDINPDTVAAVRQAAVLFIKLFPGYELYGSVIRFKIVRHCFDRFFDRSLVRTFLSHNIAFAKMHFKTATEALGIKEEEDHAPA